ncbi:hypothetical protein HMPREF9123_2694 [Neisseria bacilliformis ATCC BAA-1200]|uniref:Uncharacterized protein n=1 Tax=Neisseria bacilliformis ATCC BAA-1200 TaxID=888742 RepID=F2BG37_9NEIS|nr:hypothetical protein HMPREF9123_2694 [Neisseria bacilliformis ATCC BAA-1200]
MFGAYCADDTAHRSSLVSDWSGCSVGKTAPLTFRRTRGERETVFQTASCRPSAKGRLKAQLQRS